MNRGGTAIRFALCIRLDAEGVFCAVPARLYCIAGNDGKSYLYDTKNEKNIPIVRIDSNPERNRIVLYYREGTVQEGEAVAEVYYMCEDFWKAERGYLAKSYVAGQIGRASCRERV